MKAALGVKLYPAATEFKIGRAKEKEEKKEKKKEPAAAAAADSIGTKSRSQIQDH